MKARPLFVISCISFLFIAATISATDLSVEDSKKSDAIIGSIMSPYCPGRLLKDCPSGQALQLKEKINTRIAAGESPDLIIGDLVAIYGDQIRAAPQAQGFGLVAWLAPAIFVLLGSILTIGWLRSRRNQDQPGTSALSSELEERINSEFK